MQGLDTRLKYSLTDGDTTKKKKGKLSKEMDRMRAELEKLALAIRNIENIMREKSRSRLPRIR